MTNILKYHFYTESVDNEKEIIINSIIPLCLEKYEDLSKWGKKKTGKFAAQIQELIFEKKDDKWILIIEALGWSNNDTNRLIQYVLHKTIKEECDRNNINLTNVSYAGAHAVSDSADKYIVYDVIKKEVMK